MIKIELNAGKTVSSAHIIADVSEGCTFGRTLEFKKPVSRRLAILKAILSVGDKQLIITDDWLVANTWRKRNKLKKNGWLVNGSKIPYWRLWDKLADLNSEVRYKK